MPITYRIDAEEGMVYAFVEGDFTLEEMLSTLSKVAHDPQFRPGFSVLSDHRKIGTPATTDQVQSLVRHAQELEMLRGTKWAVVTSNELSFGMMRMFSALAETVPLRVEVFRDYDQAVIWLKNPETSSEP